MATCPSPTPATRGSELADHEALLSTRLVVPLAVGEDLHTVLCLAIVVGLPWGPVGIDQGLPIGVDELALRLGVCHAQESSLVLSCDQLLQSLILSCRARGGQLSAGLGAHLLRTLKSFFKAGCFEDLLPNTLAIREELSWEKRGIRLRCGSSWPKCRALRSLCCSPSLPDLPRQGHRAPGGA